ncbi:MAG TPA: hypothetical protein VGO11_15930 [Chthoniobacteraceae bacterium]|jgi:hypothetical protein|nr:hypothetical protein [Chthoniobacteraceae bacterium]
MFDKLRKLLKGEQRPIIRSIDDPAIGRLLYSDDDEAWLSDPALSPCGFGFCIVGDWEAENIEIRPAAALLEHAAQLAAAPQALVESVRQLVQAQLRTEKSLEPHRGEVEKLRLYRVDLPWPERPNDGEIELRTSFDSKRMWHCAYLGRQPAAALVFAGLDE